MRLLKIGRDATCDIVLHSDKVSSLHAELTLLNSGDITLEDKGSRNGTFIMNQPIKAGKPVNVRRGDAIRFGDVELQWSQVPMPEDNSAYQGVYGIGSHFNNDFQISGSTVSRYHATVKHGKDGKMYIIDHSKNGTTVDGVKISPNNPYRIKKSSAVVCGGVPVDLSRLPWPGEAWKYILGIAASLILVAGIGFGAWKFWPSKNKVYTDQELYDRYNNSIVLLKGVYHYNITIGDLNLAEFNELVSFVSSRYGITMYTIPAKMLPAGDRLIDVSSFSARELVSTLDEVTKDRGLYGGTGFFISKDGQLITNLHVVKPWLDGDAIDNIQSLVTKCFAHDVEILNKIATSTSYSAYLSQVKVEGELDYIALVPQGEIFDPENIKKCQVLSAGEDLNKDVALIKMVAGSIPPNCSYVNVKDSMDISDEALKVGNRVVTIGFPHSHALQNADSEKGIQVFFHPGQISQTSTEYGFFFNAVSAGGASGSPIFDERGMLVGVLNSGVDKENITFGIKAKYVKELLENPHKK